MGALRSEIDNKHIAVIGASIGANLAIRGCAADAIAGRDRAFAWGRIFRHQN